MLTLYHAPQSRSFRILWLLEELGEPYDIKIVPIRRRGGAGEPAGEDYRRIHPHLKVPAIAHDGVPVFETGAICLYLTDAFPRAGIGPLIGDPERAPYVTWLAYAGGVFEPALIAKAMGWEHQYGPFGWAPAEEVIAHLSRALEAGPYLLGKKFSATDIIYGGAMGMMIGAKMIPDTKLFTDYAARATDRPAFKRAQEKDAG